MIVLRVLGLCVLLAGLAGLVFDVIDGVRSGAGPTMTAIGDVWMRMHPASADLVRGRVLESGQPPTWGAGLPTLLRLPAWLMVGLVGLGLVRACGKRAGSAALPHRAAETAGAENRTGPAMPRPSGRSELAAALRNCRGALVGVGLFSAIGNVLMLTGAIFMLEVYDRVLPSRSVPTLVAIALLAGFLFAAHGVLTLIRGRILVRIGASLDEALNARVYDTVVRLPLKIGARNTGLQPLRDLDTVRVFVSGLGLAALFDLPWIPLYLGIIFAFHPWLGVTALFGAVLLIALTLLTEALSRVPMREAAALAVSRDAVAEASRRNAEALLAMGMGPRLRVRWQAAHHSFIAAQHRVSDAAGGFGAMANALRMLLQSAVLGVGAYLVIRQEASAGIIIAGAILSARALAPVDVAIAHWKGFVAARQSWQRLTTLLARLPAAALPMSLPAPKERLTVEAVSGAPPGTDRLAVQDVSFALQRGQGLAIIGPSGSGKSSLLRMLVGVWPPIRGSVRLDGAALDRWQAAALGRYIGYLPQDVELFAGTAAENIARFAPDAESTAIVTAARAAQVHELIVALPEGYDTQIGEHGAVLSAGQRQRVALARALYGDPFLVVLDEPNSNLDAEGEAALTQAILEVRARGGIVVVAAHRPSALAGVDRVLAMHQGRVVANGPKDGVLRRLLRPAAPSPEPFQEVAERRKPQP